MQTLRTTAIPIIATIAITIWLSAWITTHSRYPNAVYYERISRTSAFQGSLLYGPRVTELWVDPAHNRERMSGFGRTPDITLFMRDGTTTVIDKAGSVVRAEPMARGDLLSFRRDNGYLLKGGFRALGGARLEHAQGSVQHVSLAGHAALRFTTDQHNDGVDTLTVWIDAHTGETLQLQSVEGNYAMTQRVLSATRLSPNTLPADFFDLPRSQSTMWNSALQWARERVGISQSP